MKCISNRLLTSLWVIIAFFVLVAMKLAYIQIYKHAGYVKIAAKQRKRDVKLLYKRGYIYDRNGLELAVTVGKETVFATPYLVKNPPSAAKKLAPILKIASKEILKCLEMPRGFVFLKRKVSKAIADKVRNLKVEGIGLYKENQRYYPQARTASQLLGFVNTDNDGLSGLELKYDKILKGNLGRLKNERDAFGQSIPGTEGIFQKPVDGKSLVLTIDRDIQYKAQFELKSAIKEWDAARGSVIVLNPKTGEIYAMASEPNFNPNNFKKASKASMKSQVTSSIYEPGSTLKIVAATASISEKIFNSETMFYLPPTLNVAGKNIKEAHHREGVNYSLAEIIAKSSNVGISKVALALGKNKLYHYIKKFGLIKKTGIDYPGEVSGYVLKPKDWYGPTIATVAFGQGIAVTPLQLARAYSVIANGGKLMKPNLVREIISKDNKVVKRFRAKEIRRVINKDVAFEATLMLEKVVSNGTGKSAAIKGYTVAGKTGTAQKPNTNAKGYGDAYVSSFIGFAPAENAKILVLVVVDSPKKAIYGSQVAAPAFKNIMEFSLHKLKIEPQ